tara:strand:+ start:347 stop:1462 length:1116 start_codon:yes stop_codon:yes gene_type:complete
MTPGPSPVPSFVLKGLAKEIIHHRTDEFRAVLEDVDKGLKSVFSTANPVLILASSGTGAMEAAVSNLFSKEDKIITISGGKFGERWTEIGTVYGLNVVNMDIEWGNQPSLEDLNQLLDKNPDAKAVLTTLTETSTGTVFDVKSIAEICSKRGLLSIIDAISGLGQDLFLTDEWGVDVVVSGSQKGLMLPPGLGFISLSEKAKRALTNSNLPKYYFDLSKALKSYAKNDTPYTPAVSLIVGLKESLDYINKEGVIARCGRFAKMAIAAQKAAKSLGLDLFSKSPSASVTAICSPESIKSSEIVGILRKEHGLSIAGGQAKLKDKIFRIAHMGWINEKDLISCFSLLESVLQKLGHKFKPGSSLSVLEEVFHG